MMTVRPDTQREFMEQLVDFGGGPRAIRILTDGQWRKLANMGNVKWDHHLRRQTGIKFTMLTPRDPAVSL